jgi:hypothetical protein
MGCSSNVSPQHNYTVIGFLTLFPKELAVLPTHLPLNALNKLITDHCRLTSDESEEYTPLDMLTGYSEGSEYGGIPFENPESDETDPMNRLKAGERLALQLHLGMIHDEATFIDGQPYVATAAEIDANEDNMDDSAMFPDETGFSGLGIWLEGDRLALEPVRIGGEMNGNVCITKATFPGSLVERAAMYLRKLEAENSSSPA